MNDMNKRSSKEQIEEVLEKSMFASRWFMAPVYIVLSFSLAIIMVKVVQEFLNYLPLFLDLKIKLVRIAVKMTIMKKNQLILFINNYQSNFFLNY